MSFDIPLSFDLPKGQIKLEYIGPIADRQLFTISFIVTQLMSMPSQILNAMNRADYLQRGLVKHVILTSVTSSAFTGHAREKHIKHVAYIRYITLTHDPRLDGTPVWETNT